MAPRPTWKGYLKVSLVSVPVRAYVGSGDGGSPVRFNQLHKDCHSRIKYVKTCPLHGEVSQDEIVSGYEYEKGQYVVIEPEELDRLRAPGERAIDVDAFVPPETVHPTFLTGKTYYLTPDGQVAQKPYQLIATAMREEKLEAIARMVITSREHVVRLRAVDGLLAADVLEYATQVKDPGQFKEDVVDVSLSPQERKLTKQLIGSMVDEDLDLAQYTDHYAEEVLKLIEARVRGEEFVAPPATEEPHVVNLMDALKRSIDRADTKGRAAKPPRRKAASVTTREPAAKKTARKRKSG
jgi:DNA end-binding protein Ku